MKIKFKLWWLLFPAVGVVLFFAFRKRAGAAATPENVVPLPAPAPAPSSGGSGTGAVGAIVDTAKEFIPTAEQFAEYLKEAVGTDVDTAAGDRFNRRQEKRLDRILRREERFNERHGEAS
jgi:hypothetical protein